LGVDGPAAGGCATAWSRGAARPRALGGAKGFVVLVEEGQNSVSPWHGPELAGTYGSFQHDTGVGGNRPLSTNPGLMDTPAELGAELVLGRYRLGQRLGAGGFGTVYAAVDERLQRSVAVKVIPSGGRGDPTRAQREALAAGRLDHPGIVAIFDAGQ